MIRGAFKSSASGLPMLSSSMYGFLLCSRASETPTSSSIAAAKFECWKTSSRITSGAKIIKGVRIKRDPRWQGPRGTGEMVKLNTLESGERHTADCILAGVSITTAYFLRSHPVSGAERVFEHARRQQDPVHHHPQNHLLLAHRASGIRLLPSESRGKSLQ